MRIEMLKSKLHRATVTGADLEYEGSISIDPELYKAAEMREYEKVDVLNINNGARLTTYIIKGEKKRDMPERSGRPYGPPGRQGYNMHLLQP